MKQRIHWKVFFILLGLSLVSILCVFPYVLTVQGDLFAQIGQPIKVILLAQIVQSLILFSVTIFCGLLLAPKVNFKLPLLEAIVQKQDYKSVLKTILGKSVYAGIAVAVIIYIVDALFTFIGVVISTHQSYAPAWQKLLAAVYGGATEEILMRLFMITLFVWIGMKIARKTTPSRAIIFVSIILASIIFGLGHLPITASLTQLTPLVITRAIILNGIGGVIFGWLFWKKGLESAMIAHFTADVFLLTLLPMIFG